MAIKRLYEGFDITSDSCIGGTHPMRESDPPGLYLGRNPLDDRWSLYITFWEADEIAQKIGFPHIAVYEEQKKLIDEQAQRIADLEAQLESEIHSLQLKEVLKTVATSEKKVLSEIQSYTGAVRARISDVGSMVGPVPARKEVK